MTILYYSISKGLKLLPILKKRGRCKGHKCTTIGVPAKQLKSSKKPKSFSSKHSSEKERDTCNTEWSANIYLTMLRNVLKVYLKRRKTVMFG